MKKLLFLLLLFFIKTSSADNVTPIFFGATQSEASELAIKYCIANRTFYNTNCKILACKQDYNYIWSCVAVGIDFTPY